MGAQLKTGIIVDVEATCWETRTEQGAQPNEIIEIGVAVLDFKSGAIVDNASIVVKPRFTKVSPFCTQLTGWTQEAVDEGFDIVDALRDFESQFNPSRESIWFSCGEYDRLKLSSKTGKPGLFELYGITADQNPFDLMRSHLNIKTLFALKQKMSKEVGMERMLNIMNERLEGRHHNGADDAKNIAKIVRYVLS